MVTNQYITDYKIHDSVYELSFRFCIVKSSLVIKLFSKGLRIKDSGFYECLVDLGTFHKDSINDLSVFSSLNKLLLSDSDLDVIIKNVIHIHRRLEKLLLQIELNDDDDFNNVLLTKLYDSQNSL